jgi:ribosome-associated translation inhibitor RaiA
MEIVVHSDSSTFLSPDMSRHIRGVLEDRLARFSARLTRVDVGFTDENARMVGVRDHRCTLEARAAGMEPRVVTADAVDLVASFDVAVDKLEHALASRLGKESDVKGSPSIRTMPAL